MHSGQMHVYLHACMHAMPLGCLQLQRGSRHLPKLVRGTLAILYGCAGSIHATNMDAIHHLE